MKNPLMLNLVNDKCRSEYLSYLYIQIRKQKNFKIISYT